MIIKFWRDFSKKSNSTKRPDPDAEGYYAVDCYLKEPTSVISPVITVQRSDFTTASMYNYAYIPEFDRYYYVNDIVSMGNLWMISMNTDVLATYRSNIGNTDLYILRASNAYDGNIIDNFYPVKTEYTYEVTNAGGFFSDTGAVSMTDGCFILGVVAKPSSNSTNFGSIQYVAVSASPLKRIITSMLENTVIDDNGFSTDDATLALQKSIIDPLSYIKSCVWLPVSVMDIPDTVFHANVLNVWDWQLTSVPNFRITSSAPYLTITKTINVVNHPDTYTRGNYVNASPYTRLSLIAPPFGMFDIDTSLTCQITTITCFLILDVISGLATLEIRTGDHIVQHRVKAQVGVPIQLSQVTYDYVGAAQGLVGSIGSFITGNIFGGIDGAIGTAASAMTPHQSSMGSNGSFSELIGRIRLIHTFYKLPDDDNNHAGRPYCKMKKPSELGGFIIAREGDVPLPATGGEAAEIKGYLEGGFFYE